MGALARTWLAFQVAASVFLCSPPTFAKQNALIGCNVSVGITGKTVLTKTDCGFEVKGGFNKGWIVIQGKDQHIVFKIPADAQGLFSYVWDWDYGTLNGREFPVTKNITRI